MKPVLLVTEPAYFKSVLPQLARVGRVILGTPKRRDILRAIPLCDAVILRVETVIDRDILLHARKLRLIASATTGINHIDAAAARRRGIRIIHLHGAHTTPTAEHTLALLLALARRIPGAHRSMTTGRWDRALWIGTQLSGKTLGIIGIGRIGGAVARMAPALGMKVIAYDPYVRGVRGVRMYSTLAALLNRSDIVSVHACLTPETRHLLGTRQFQQLKRGALLINAARGEIVSETALLAALKSGRLAGAALDVYSTEPPPRTNPLRAYARRHANLILTPHLGASTAEAVNASADEIAGAVEKFFS